MAFGFSKKESQGVHALSVGGADDARLQSLS